MKFCRSRNLTVTNKILHYLLGGLAVIASDTAGHQEVARRAVGGVRIYPSGNPEALANELNSLLSNPEACFAGRKRQPFLQRSETFAGKRWRRNWCDRFSRCWEIKGQANHNMHSQILPPHGSEVSHLGVPPMSSKIPFNKPFIAGKELYYIAQAVTLGNIAGDGHFTRQCSPVA